MKQQIILIVGPDRAGKSNIAAALSNILDISVFKASNEHAVFLSDQKRFINELRFADPRMIDILKQTGLSLILDRSYVCEKVYSEYFGRETDVGMLRYVDDEFAKLGAKIIICTRKSFDGIVDDLDSDLDSKALTIISSLYQHFAKWTNCETYTLFVDDEDLNRETNEILKFLNK